MDHIQRDDKEFATDEMGASGNNIPTSSSLYSTLGHEPAINAKKQVAEARKSHNTHLLSKSYVDFVPTCAATEIASKPTSGLSMITQRLKIQNVYRQVYSSTCQIEKY